MKMIRQPFKYCIYDTFYLRHHNEKGKWAAIWQNQQNDLRAHRRLTSAWASTQSDPSLRCPHEESLGP